MKENKIIKLVTKIAKQNGLKTDEQSILAYAIVYVTGQRDQLKEMRKD